MPEDDVECQSFTIISVDSCLWEQILSTNICRHCPYKTVNTEMVDYLGDNLFESD